ncbi:MAG: TetR/AcrR family transcriptional regulator, partial [Gammaproteobacteria bacterium]|nr:TetR/AcrR family transcriptional regulator [Gammaproteobacteria bacterium]
MTKKSSTREEIRSARQYRIEEATYELLAESGYHACSMLSIAKRAKASNETLYRWYGDKVGL